MSAENKVKVVFGRGVYVDENTDQAARVELVCQSRPIMRAADCKKLAEKAEGLFRQA